MLLRKTFRFEASHVLPKHPGKCSRLHGHSWVLHVFVEGKVNPDTGFVMDYAHISDAFKQWIERNLDHRHLGTNFSGVPLEWIVPFDYNTLRYPSSENLLWWLGEIFQEFPWSKLALEETCTSYAELTREEFNAADQVRT